MDGSNNVVNLHRRPEYSEEAEIEINRWKAVAYRNQDEIYIERQARRTAIRWSLFIGILIGAGLVSLWQ